jgi:hypothetical protein
MQERSMNVRCLKIFSGQLISLPIGAAGFVIQTHRIPKTVMRD